MRISCRFDEGSAWKKIGERASSQYDGKEPEYSSKGASDREHVSCETQECKCNEKPKSEKANRHNKD